MTHKKIPTRKFNKFLNRLSRRVLEYIRLHENNFLIKSEYFRNDHCNHHQQHAVWRKAGLIGIAIKGLRQCAAEIDDEQLLKEVENIAALADEIKQKCRKNLLNNDLEFFYMTEPLYEKIAETREILHGLKSSKKHTAVLPPEKTAARKAIRIPQLPPAPPAAAMSKQTQKAAPDVTEAELHEIGVWLMYLPRNDRDAMLAEIIRLPAPIFKRIMQPAREAFQARFVQVMTARQGVNA